ncbi:VOC family protein [Solicola gregarius]|uniref:VOC family protein n=1 Tax=Solicola gregarius TaxID=2908642 RepID=A0AA46TFG9_9ACTN|nr:VOC family protein [Solicola gregarius]UYM04190.1 VOC family protein [Solicola gregarius]
MTALLNPYLNFRTEARAAMDFYQSVFGGDLDVSTYGDFQASDDPAEKDKVMHSQLTTPTGFTLMASDLPAAMPYEAGNNFSVSLSGGTGDEAELRGYWDKLVEGGTVTMPLDRAPWGDSFGICTDRFGVGWLMNIAGTPGE